MTEEERVAKWKGEHELLTDFLEGYFRACGIQADRGQVRYIAEKAKRFCHGGAASEDYASANP